MQPTLEQMKAAEEAVSAGYQFKGEHNNLCEGWCTHDHQTMVDSVALLLAKETMKAKEEALEGLGKHPALCTCGLTFMEHKARGI